MDSWRICRSALVLGLSIRWPGIRHSFAGGNGIDGSNSWRPIPLGIRICTKKLSVDTKLYFWLALHTCLAKYCGGKLFSYWKGDPGYDYNQQPVICAPSLAGHAPDHCYNTGIGNLQYLRWKTTGHGREFVGCAYLLAFIPVIVTLLVMSPEKQTASAVFTHFTDDGAGWSSMGLTVMVGQVSSKIVVLGVCPAAIMTWSAIADIALGSDSAAHRCMKFLPT